MEAQVGEATEYHSLCVGEEASKSSSIPLTSPLPLSIYIKTPLPQASTEVHWKHLFSRPAEGFSIEQPGEVEGIVLTWLTSNLHSEVLCYHAVPGSQISVDKFVGI